MKIIHIINTLEFGGAEARVVSLLNALSENHCVSLICLNARGGFRKHLNDSIILYDLNVTGKIALLKAVLQVIIILYKTKPDIFHTHLVQASLVGRLAAKITGISSTVSTQHNAWHPKERTWLYSIECLSWDISRGMIALSLAIERYLRTRGYSNYIKVIYTGIESPSTNLFKETSIDFPSNYLLTVGHFRDNQKGHDILLRAYALLDAKTRVHFHLVLIGEGKCLEKLKAEAQRLGIDQQTHFLGKREDVRSIMRSCFAFILASRWEGLGRVIIEAMSEGRPIIATNTEGIPELIRDNVTGLLVPPENPEALADAIESLVSNQHLCERLGTAGKDRYQIAYTVEQMTKEVESFYTDLIKT